jgi:hypothetical protein
MRGRYVFGSVVGLVLAFSGPLTAVESRTSPTVELTGVSQFVAWTVALEENRIISPPQNACPIIEARLTRGPGFFVQLYTREDCQGGGFVRDVKWNGMLGHDGSLALQFPRFATVRYSDGTSERVDVWAQVKEHTGCPLNGTFPVYHGHFDGTYLHAVGEFQGVCDGGTLWGPLFGVSEELGPLHVDFLVSLKVSQ